MGKYFKRFENHSQYEQYIQGGNYIKPNISVCDSEREIHYNSLFVHDYVDLSLPSGTLWATENIKDSNGNNLYFTWGDTQGYAASQVGTDKNFSWDDYKFGTSDNLTKYNSTDGKTILDSEDDAATVLWGENWCMPTKEQFQELVANTTATWTTTDGKTGITFTSTINGNSVFFLAFGTAMDGEMHSIDNDGYYWSRSSYVDYGAWSLYFLNNKKKVNTSSVTRYNGRSVRPVKNLLNQ